MPNENQNLDSMDLDDPSWDNLAVLLDRLSNAWEKAPPEPALKDFVPAAPENYRSLALIELVKADMEFRSQRKEDWRPLEEYLREWPEIKSAGSVPPDLILEEHEIKKRRDSTVRADDMLDRFPDQAGELSRIAKDEKSSKSVAAFRARHLRNYQPGQTVDDFDLLTSLGRGAFATVFLARQNSMQRLVALKISADQGMEPQTLAQLDHPNIVRVYDQRVLKNKQVRLMYMQFVPGGTLDEVVNLARKGEGEPSGASFVMAVNKLLYAKGQSIPEDSENRRWLKQATWTEVTAHIGSQLADALGYAHRHGVLHRDLKPANILIDANCSPKVVDFNISFSTKIAGASPASYFGGSLSYMSPEQLEATSLKHDRTPDSLDGRSDQFAIGVIVCEMLTGKRPFRDKDDNGHWSEHVPNMIDVRRRGLSPESMQRLDEASVLLRDGIKKCLEPDPDDRFSDPSLAARQFRWATNRDIAGYLAPESKTTEKVSSWAIRFPFLTLCIFGTFIGGGAVLFIYTYNAIQVVPFEDRPFFDTVRATVNRLAFPLGMILFFFYMNPLRKVLRKIGSKEKTEVAEVNRGLKIAMRLGAFFGIVVAIEWTIAGLLYPIVLSIANVPLTGQGWFDFIVSHLLAGITMGSYLYGATTCVAVVCWVPVLIRNSLNAPIEIDWKAESSLVSRQMFVAQVLAVASPMIAVALLVNVHKSSDTFALGILSVVGLLGLVLLVFTSRLIQKSVQVLKQL